MAGAGDSDDAGAGGERKVGTTAAGSSCMPPFAARGITPPAETNEVGRPTRLPFSFSLLSSSSFFFLLLPLFYSSYR
jgi:hypothetical protein